MDAVAARAMYRRQIDKHGEDVTLRRYAGTGGARAVTNEATVKARVTGYDAKALAGAILQGDRRIIMLAEDVEAKGFPTPITHNDKVVVHGQELAIVAPDSSTRTIAGTLIAYELQARGP